MNLYDIDFKRSMLDMLDIDHAEKITEWEVSFWEALAYQSIHAPDSRTCCGVAMWGALPLYIGGYFPADIDGIFDPNGANAEVFIVPDSNAKLVPHVFIRSVIRWRRMIEAKNWCTRIQSHCLPEVSAWMRACGFVYERSLSQYHGGRDYELWGRNKIDGLWRAI